MLRHGRDRLRDIDVYDDLAATMAELAKKKKQQGASAVPPADGECLLLNRLTDDSLLVAVGSYLQLPFTLTGSSCSQRLRRCLRADQSKLTIPRGAPVKPILSRMIAPRVENVQMPPTASDDDVVAVATACTGLKNLSLDMCGNLTAVSLQAVGKSCPNLSYINLYGCVSLDDSAITALAEGCHMLGVCIMSGCKGLGDESVVSLANNCPELNYVSLAYLKEVTDEGVGALGDACDKMAGIDITGCDQVLAPTVAKLRQRDPPVQVIGR